MEPNERFRARREARHADAASGAARSHSALLLGRDRRLATLGARFVIDDEPAAKAGAPAAPADSRAAKPRPVKQPRPLPVEMRGIHVTVALASLAGKLAEYVEAARQGLNTIELDVKDESGEIGFVAVGRAARARRRRRAAVLPAPRGRASWSTASGVYLIGRVVVFQDPLLARARPGARDQGPDGSVWHNRPGSPGSNPYDRRVWDYNVSIAEVAARAGFDEIMFDYVRFPSDGDVDAIVYPGRQRLRRAG